MPNKQLSGSNGGMEQMLMLDLAALAALAAVAAPPAGEMVRPQDPQTLARALQSAGYAATLETDKTGDPMITSGVSGSKFQIFFYNCTNNRDCATVQFHAGYALEKKPSLQSINEWNKLQRFGRAYLDNENDPIVEMDVDLDDGGVSPSLFIDNIEFWDSTLTKFERHIGYRN
jgi:Putative bacterial sensory transduction regulator